MRLYRTKQFISVVMIILVALITVYDPTIWQINLITVPLGLIVILFSRYAKPLDDAYLAVKHLKGKSERADLMLYLLKPFLRKDVSNLRLIQTHLKILIVDFPEDKNSLNKAWELIDMYLKRTPW